MFDLIDNVTATIYFVFYETIEIVSFLHEGTFGLLFPILH